MRIFQNILDTAQEKAINTLHANGIFVLDDIKVHLAVTSPDSYCLGYDTEDPVEIYVNGMRLTEALVSRKSREALTEFLVHEYGHAFLFKLWNTSLTTEERTEFTRLFGDYDSDGSGYKYRISDVVRTILRLKPRDFDTEQFASLYAVTSPHEDWAETFAFLVCGKSAPREKAGFVAELIVKYGR